MADFSLSVVVVPNGRLPAKLSLNGASEVIVVASEEADFDLVGTAGCSMRTMHSAAPAGQRANIGISRAMSDWVVVLTGREMLSPGWIPEMKVLLEQGNFCAFSIRSKKGGVPLVVVWRPAFAYGSLDGSIDDAGAAMENWLSDIFPRHRHRVLQREGFRNADAEWLESESANRPEVSMRTIPAPSTGESYEPRQFWERGGRGWVKWEAYQPDESEILGIVERVRPQTVFEIGCGGGRNGRYFADADFYAGLDISMPLLDRARDRQEPNSIGLVCGDAVRLPFADEAFDLVFAVSTIQHVTPRWIDTCIADIARVSRRYIGLIEFTEELPGNDTWFRQSHMFRHDYVSLMAPYANLRYRAATGLQIQPAMKEVFLFEKPRPA